PRRSSDLLAILEFNSTDCESWLLVFFHDHLPFESTTPVAIPFTITRSMSALQESQGVFASTMIPSSSTTKPDAFHGSWNAAAAHCHTVFAEKSKPPNTSVASSHQMNPRACGSSS